MFPEEPSETNACCEGCGLGMGPGSSYFFFFQSPCTCPTLVALIETLDSRDPHPMPTWTMIAWDHCHKTKQHFVIQAKFSFREPRDPESQPSHRKSHLGGEQKSTYRLLPNEDSGASRCGESLLAQGERECAHPDDLPAPPKPQKKKSPVSFSTLS